MKSPLLLASLLLAPCLLAQDPLAVYRDVEWEIYRDEANGFTMRYPYSWSFAPGRTGVYAYGTFHLPSLNIEVRPREAESDLAASTRKVALARYGPPMIASERGFELSGMPAYEVVVDWAASTGEGVPLVSRVVSVFRGDKWFAVVATDGKAIGGFDKTLATALYSLILE